MLHQPFLSGLVLPPLDMPPASRDLRHWPDVSAETVCQHARRLGSAGELLFDSQMLCFGEKPLDPGEFFPFDRLILRAPRALRVQIKSVIMPAERGGYSVEPRKGYRGSPRGIRRYEDGDFDLLAIVLLRESVIRYSAEKAARYHIPLACIEQLRRDPRASFDSAIAALDAAARDDTAPDASSAPAPY